MSATLSGELQFEPPATKGSRFLVRARPAGDEDSCRAFRAEVAAAMSDASHHCWAWSLSSPSVDRCSDDGEPSGSSGRPMLAQLKGRDIVHVAVVVTRYFGGTKLGVGGLVRAYGGAVGQAFDHHRDLLVPWEVETSMSIEHGHADNAAVTRVLRDFDATETSVSYDAAVERHILIADSRIVPFEEALANATSGRARVERSR